MFGTVRDVLRHKGTRVHSIAPGASALDAAVLMNQNRIGSLVVVDDGAVIGIITERDILTRVVAREQIPSHTPVVEVMSSPILTCTPDTTLNELRSTMREHRIRHVPVMDADQVIGVVSIGDITYAEHETLNETIHYLEAYIASA